jgi:alpha-glucosidase
MDISWSYWWRRLLSTQTSKVKCVIQKADMRVSILIYRNYFTWRWIGFSLGESYEHGGNIVKMSKASKDGECFMALEIKRPNES